MAEEDQDQKTEQPTGKRLGEARERGQLPVSREIGSWMSLLGTLIVVAWLAPGMAKHLMMILRIFLESPHAFTVDDKGLQSIVYNAVVQVGLATGLIFVVMSLLVATGTMLQTGFFASAQLIVPDFSRLSLIRGWQRLASVNSLIELAKSFGKMIVLGLVVYIILSPLWPHLPVFANRPMMDSVAFLHDKAIHLIIILLLVFTLIALGDLVYQRYSYIKSMKMTKAEVKDEFRQQEGDPIIKARLRQIRLEKARKRMMAQVPKADVIITNPTHYAIALKYDSAKMTAPVVLAKGIDRIAERIRDLATEHNITLVSNPPLARALYDTVDIDQEIPTQHYRAVAEVISYVYKLKKKIF